ncbi:tyrosine--tRNA ligase [Rozella allomycis CSF55]|uniref:Tyrosine--tRNA ligase n=1 Tax=Rozella allomycis (strain CSF55) TaxID=988480 RepID=A0A075AWW1_ROZAC|nr:Tyrosine-tRNA ligase, bacterial-type domain-containing protein [Rozella allomycis CSF55]RKP21543.1 tyrosine--tRNA ligase [Rozella allomycis CSF55]|eukprot:EPZ34599.1 Tyrosine-tRNA ligase, bacterial-type domain-containing protein [Rozella allomycis CSF55]
MNNFIQSLKNRNLLHQSTFKSIIPNDITTIYGGFDPTAKSLHVGNALLLMALFRGQIHGLNSIYLVGGATGLIGDPSFKDKERPELSIENVYENTKYIMNQIKQWIHNAKEFSSMRGINTPGKELILNNADWLGKISFIDFLKRVGKHSKVSIMLQRECVKKRMEREESISYTEFTYQLLQGYDYHYLYKNYNCTLQIGGSDQLGNMIAGIDLIHRVERFDSPVFAATLPLLTNDQGKKYGKSEGNAIWLDETLCSPFDFYQFFLNSTDSLLERLLFSFTFLDAAEIAEILNEHEKNPEKRIGQIELASHVTELFHGSLKKAHTMTQLCFGSKDSFPSSSSLMDAFVGSSNFHSINQSNCGKSKVADILALVGICKSKSKTI